MKITVIIVTYGNRTILLREVISSLKKQNISGIIIVNNHSTYESSHQLNNLAQESNKLIDVINLPENTGSAMGFAAGLFRVYNNPGCEFIWLLDDDNRPEREALEILKQVWSRLEDDNKSETVCLVSSRKGRPLYNRAVQENNPGLVLGRKNTFRAFHIADIPEKIYRKFLGRTWSAGECLMKEYGEIYAAPYGGMFFHKNLIGNIGYPDQKYYLYVDDHEFSYRIIKKGGKILFVPGSKIEDIDQSWHTRTGGLAFFRMARDNNFIRLFYSVRNRVYFEKTELVSNWIVYLINMGIYSAMFFITALAFLRFKNIMIYFLALQHGLSGRMGVDGRFRLV